MTLKSFYEGDVLVIEINCKSIDVNNVALFKREIFALLTKSHDVVFDLTGLEFIDSSGLGVLLACMRRIKTTGNELKLCALHPTVQSIVKLVRMNRILGIYETRGEALASTRPE